MKSMCAHAIYERPDQVWILLKALAVALGEHSKLKETDVKLWVPILESKFAETSLLLVDAAEARPSKEPSGPGIGAHA